MSDEFDWASYSRLRDAVMIGTRDADVALTRLESFVDLDAVTSFVLSDNRIEYDWGTSLWQEVAVTDGQRLIMWHGCDAHCPGTEDLAPHRTFESSVRTVHLSELRDQTVYAEYIVEDDGTRALSHVDVNMQISRLKKTVQTTVTESEPRYSYLTFNKSRHEHGLAQLERLMEFGAALARC